MRVIFDWLCEVIGKVLAVLFPVATVVLIVLTFAVSWKFATVAMPSLLLSCLFIGLCNP